MSLESMTIELYGINFTVTGDYEVGEEQTHDYQGSPSNFTHQTIEVGGVEVEEVLAKGVITILEEEFITQFNS